MDCQKITIVLLALFLEACVSLPGQKFKKEETGRSASELIKLCTSTDDGRLAYCEGYIDGAIHICALQPCTQTGKIIATRYFFLPVMCRVTTICY